MPALPQPLRSFRLLTIVIAILIASAYFAAARMAGPDGSPVPPQPDSLLFMQYARALAEGHPYRFQASDPPSTGSTSHVYPALLAVFYAAGARDNSLVTAGFALNTLLFLLYVAMIWNVAWRISPRAAPLAGLLAALSGQTAYTFFTQSDMGLFMVVSLGVLLAALGQRWIVLALIMALVPWVRPEGILLAAGLGVAALSPWPNNKRKEMFPERMGLLMGAAAGCVGFLGVLIFNAWLTGVAGYQSTIGKGLIGEAPLWQAIRATAFDLVMILREVILGLGGGGRPFLTIPVVGAALAVFGLAARFKCPIIPTMPGHGTRAEAGWILAGAVSALLVATSGWLGQQYDRYFAWLIPVGLIYMATGVAAASRLRRRPAEKGDAIPASRRAFLGLAVALALYQTIGTFWYIATYAQHAQDMGEMTAFARRAGELTPAGSRIAVPSRSGLAYYLPQHRIINISGITAPQFTFGQNYEAYAEIIKRQSPDERPQFWLMLPDEADHQIYKPFIGRQVAAQTPVFGDANALALYEATWKRLDAGSELLTSGTLHAIRNLAITATLNVGDPDSEARAAYSVFTRVAGSKTYSFLATGNLAGEEIAEVGRVILGSETFNIPVQPGRPLTVVMRTARAARARTQIPRAGIQYQNFEFASPVKMPVIVNGGFWSEIASDLPEETSEWAEIVFTIPSELITGAMAEITVGGDHITFNFWFYQ